MLKMKVRREGSGGGDDEAKAHGLSEDGISTHPVRQYKFLSSPSPPLVLVQPADYCTIFFMQG